MDFASLCVRDRVELFFLLFILFPSVEKVQNNVDDKLKSTKQYNMYRKAFNKNGALSSAGINRHEPINGRSSAAF
ncbi:hypothetical protein DYE50_09560 [Treponema ruminis]|nr:hypothetical protein DYE50_09560 [Treponema ruminis]